MDVLFGGDCETLGAFLNRAAAQRIHLGVPALDQGVSGSFARTDVVELCGLAGAGKTEFLYAVAMSSVLEAPNKHVVYLDLDYKFEPYRVSYLLQHRLQMNQRPAGEHGGQSEEETRRKLMEDVNRTFERLHVFSCSSSLQFLATLKVLATDFVPSLYERGGTLGAIVVDNISAYWDVLRELKSNHVGLSKGATSRGGGEAHLHPSMVEAIVHSLTELRNMCDVPVVISRRIPREVFHDVGNRQWNDFVVKRASLGCRLDETREKRTTWREGHTQDDRGDVSNGSRLERTLCWVKGEKGSTRFVIHPSHGVL